MPRFLQLCLLFQAKNILRSFFTKMALQSCSGISLLNSSFYLNALEIPPKLCLINGSTFPLSYLRITSTNEHNFFTLAFYSADEVFNIFKIIIVSSLEHSSFLAVAADKRFVYEGRWRWISMMTKLVVKCSLLSLRERCRCEKYFSTQTFDNGKWWKILQK